jgi:ABC-2 type transport system ATP-binding protein
MSIAVQFTDVTCRIKGREVLRGVTFGTHQGAIEGVLGPNGAGKSTLLSLISGLRTRFDGAVSVFGERLPARGHALRQRIGVVLQETALYDELTAEENLAFAAALYGAPVKRVGAVLELLGLTERAGDPVRILSGGMQRRVAIARALLHDPELLVIDEPTLGVDVEARHAIWEHLRVLKAQGRTVLVATNYLDEALALCDTVVVLRDGVLLTQESPTSLMERTGFCLEITCAEAAIDGIVALLRDLPNIIVIDRSATGISVFLNSNAAPEPTMRLVVDNSAIDGIRLRPPDLAEIFSILDEPA